MGHMNFHYTKEFRKKMKNRHDRAQIKDSDIESTLMLPDEWYQQKNNNFSAWKYIKSEGKVLRVIIADDGKTIVTAYYDRDYLKKYKREKQNESNELYDYEDDEYFAY